MILPNFPPSDPDDSAATLAPELLAELLEKAQRVDELTQTVELNSEVITSLKQRIQVLEEALRLSRIKRFAPSSEQSGQTSLFDEAEAESTIALEATADEAALDSDALPMTIWIQTLPNSMNGQYQSDGSCAGQQVLRWLAAVPTRKYLGPLRGGTRQSHSRQLDHRPGQTTASLGQPHS